MAFKKNTDGISLDKGAASSALVTDLAVDLEQDLVTAISDGDAETLSAAEDYVDTAIENVVGLAPETLDTLAELATALGDGTETITTLQSNVADLQENKADLVDGFVDPSQLDSIQDAFERPMFYSLAYDPSDASSSYMVYSADGLSWETVGEAMPRSSQTIILNGDSRIVILDRYNTSARYSDAKTPTSWTEISLGYIGSAYGIMSGIYANNRFFAFGYNAMSSTDGISWTISQQPVENIIFNDVAYGNGKFVAVSSGQYNSIFYSTDGFSWSSTSVNNASWSFVTFSNGRFIASGYDQTGIWSTDGITWTTIATPRTYHNAALYVNNTFVMPTNSAGIYWSTDNVNWSGPSYATFSTIQNITYADEKYIVTSRANGSVSYSTDLASWSTASALPEPYVFDISYSDNAIGYGAQASISSISNIASRDYVDHKVSNLVTTNALEESGYATESYVDTAVAGIVDTAPAALNTLNELAAALGDDENFATTVTNAIAGKANTSHTHAISDVTNLQTSLGAKKNEATYEISTNTNLTAGGRYMVDTGTALTLTLPATPAVGDEIQIFDKTNTAETNNITVNNNGLKINGVVDTLIIDVNGAVAGLVYTGTSLGWRV